MSVPEGVEVPRVAARAALAVPGVTGLQRTLRRSLADAAHRVPARREAPSHEAGVRARHDRRSGTWHLEVRCVLDDGRRALDAARDVRDSVRTRVGSHLADLEAEAPVDVTVEVTRIDTRAR
ncbi:hypothetical protein [Streptomyces fuscigenes]|uniref:hypothetical protein n=1 Tax=Streptomyces fuscigenes TaxID=1528880 RepID=UPI001F486051|nr:hypothetical protein [Streptomyces fuscigenes]MCF3961116.1 hypothetical protein [Streptomyces fuscigenes]